MATNNNTSRKRRRPEWANHGCINVYRRERNWLNDNLPIKYSIDHVIPSKGETVTGLDLHTNLRLMTAYDNNRKSNKLLPELVDLYMKTENWNQ